MRYTIKKRKGGNRLFEKLRNSKLMFWSFELLILATLILVSSKINFIFEPIGTFFSTLFAPVLIAGFLYYILNPIVKLLMRTKIKRTWAVVLVLLMLLTAIIWILLSVIPNLVQQISSLASNMPDFIKQVERWLREMAELPIFKEVNISKYLDQLDISYGRIIQQFLSGISSSLGSIVGTIASATIVIVTAPFILFYMLKDGEKLVPNIERFFPEKRRSQIVELLGQLNQTLANYISGQAIECLFVGTFTFLGYFLLGVDYAFLFGVIAGLTNLIPYLGPYLGLAPAFLVTVFNEPFKALLCCVVVLVVQQLDGNIIYPNVIGKSLKIHPLTIIIVLLVAGNIAGLLGIFLGVPFYAICKTIVSYVIKIVKEDQRNESTKKIATTP
ncbi:AI-2E family transporter [Enterococcus thailandicus]|uniref:AI-2E family transporter n=1 Tax=Enterococcus sp. C50 TaxID=3231311 RepID=UPI0008FFFE25|nr:MULTISPECIES: AI-2E family transporter [Enterococcus]ASZ07909.1 AI-2E family transporter [Enterococcus thailandicus]MDA3964055.1 AI-2E family transporter [Enterococcus thailandicus]MDA3973519.1 AI-2E family transporter [Enterococcus thailandicus]MDA3975896.1 AI-2E family transporter [Enterococcus thailandicus]MDA3980978.1 AI-2E family transporter [Enterococcus thailandicus]